MKKILILTVIATFFATSAFAGATIAMASPLTKATTGKTVWAASTGTAAATDTLIGKTSTGVGVGIRTLVTGYALTTQHVNGTKAYGSSYDSTSIYFLDVDTVGTPKLGTPTQVDTTDFVTWTIM